MLCQECRKRPATVKVTTIVGDQKREVHLCDECAAIRGEVEFGAGAKISLGDMLAALLHHTGLLGQEGAHPASEAAKCPECGLTFAQFAKTGRLGCGECFKAFEDQLKPVLRHIHGSTRHAGRMPRRAGGALRLQREVANLRRELAAAVQAEQFERAAQLRDRIRSLEDAISDEVAKPAAGPHQPPAGGGGKPVSPGEPGQEDKRG
jgi:protein arginine kinase activator